MRVAWTEDHGIVVQYEEYQVYIYIYTVTIVQLNSMNIMWSEHEYLLDLVMFSTIWIRVNEVCLLFSDNPDVTESKHVDLTDPKI